MYLLENNECGALQIPDFVTRRFVPRGILPRLKVQTPLIKERGISIQLRQGPWEHIDAVSI